MTKGDSKATRQRIIEAGARLIHSRGFNNTGIKDILDEAGVPKGSFYFYFKNKEDFGIQVVDYFTTYFGGVARALERECDGPPLERLRTIVRGFTRFFKDQGASLGCPLGNLAQEMGDLSPAFREKLSVALAGMTRMFESYLYEAKECGDLGADQDTAELASFMVAGWHGALVHMKVAKTVEPLERYERMVFDRLLAHKAAPV